MARKVKKEQEWVYAKRALPKRKSSKPTKAEEYAQISYEDLRNEKSVKELEKIYTTLRKGYTTRKKTLEKYYDYIPAVDAIESQQPAFTGTIDRFRKKFEKSFSVLIDVLIGQGKNPARRQKAEEYKNELRHQIRIFQAFFRNKTSTIEGNEEWRRNVDKAIYGASLNGEPQKHLSENERKKFWSVYNQWQKDHKNLHVDSNQVINLVNALSMESVDDLDVTPNNLSKISAKYTLQNDFRYIRALYKDYLKFNGSEKGAADYIAEHFLGYDDDREIFREELEKAIQAGDYDDGTVIFTRYRVD